MVNIASLVRSTRDSVGSGSNIRKQWTFSAISSYPACYLALLNDIAHYWIFSDLTRAIDGREVRTLATIDLSYHIVEQLLQCSG